MYRSIKMLLTVGLFSLLFSSVVNGSNMESNAAQSIVIDSTLKIKKLEDGRIEGIKNAAILTENQTDKILKEMNFSKDEIEELPFDFKRHLVSRGGMSVKIESKVKRIYYDANGVKHEITAKNEEEIESLRNKDIKEFGAKDVSTLSVRDQLQDGIFSMKGTLIYLGKTSNNLEYKYDYYTDYRWNGVPQNYYKDTIAQAWQSHTDSVTRNGAHNYKPYCNNYNMLDTTNYSITASGSGSKATFNLYGSGCELYGALHDEVRIPVTNHGLTGQWISGYAHPYSNFVVNAVLSWINVDFESFWGDEWYLTNTFTIGVTT